MVTDVWEQHIGSSFKVKQSKNNLPRLLDLEDGKTPCLNRKSTAHKPRLLIPAPVKMVRNLPTLKLGNIAARFKFSIIHPVVY
jgi:hypothetical protein